MNALAHAFWLDITCEKKQMMPIRKSFVINLFTKYSCVNVVHQNRPWCWPNIESTSGQRLVFAG